MRLLKQSTAYDLMVFMVDATDFTTGETGLTLTITASKAGAAFASISPTVTERGNGWYSLALTTSHTDTAGDLALHITGTGAAPSDLVVQVRPLVPGDSVTVGTNNDKTGYSLTQTFPANFASLAVSAGGHVVLQDGSLVTAKLGTFALAKTTNITGFNDLSASQVNAEADAALADARAGYVAAIEAEIADDATGEAVKQAVIDKLIENLPSLDDLTLAAIAAAVRDVNNTSPAANSLGAAVNTKASQTSVDDLPTNAELATALAAADDAVLAALASKATQASVDDLPTNAELATALGTADDAVISAIGALNNLSQAQAQTAAAAALSAYDPPTNTEMEARTLAAASYATATALLAVHNKTVNLPASPAATSDIPTFTQMWTGALTESYAADGAAFTPAQGLFMLWSALSQFDIVGDTISSKRLDGTTEAMTFEMDDATSPTSRVRAS